MEKWARNKGMCYRCQTFDFIYNKIKSVNDHRKVETKRDSALSYAKENELVYHLVYKNDLESFCNTLINSLDLDESPRSQDK